MNLTTIRESFPGLAGRVFLDSAAVSLMPVQARDALVRLADAMVGCPSRDASAHHIRLDLTADIPRREAARLINAKPENIALVESTTQGLQAVAAAVPLQRGDNILIADTEFLGLAVPWIPRRAAEGFEIRVVPTRSGRVLVDDFAAAADARTRMILLSTVQWSSGFRADLAAFCEFASSRGIVLVADAIQQLGAVDLDVSATPVDFLVTGGHKWLLSPVGRGFLYVSDRMLERAGPGSFGYLNIRQPAEGWVSYFGNPTTPAVRDYEFVSDARRFESGGTANYPGNAALGAALELINTLGPGACRDRIFSLTDRLLHGLKSAGAMVISPPEHRHRSGIVSFSLGRGHAADKAFLKTALDRRIVISQRYTAGVGGLRASVHFFNNEEEMDALAALVAEAMRG